MERGPGVLKKRFRTYLLAAATAAGIVGAAGVARACPKCRLGAAALTGSQNVADPLLPEFDLAAMLEGRPVAGEKANPSDPAAGAPAAKDPSQPRRLSISGGVNFTTAYYHRGYLQENKGFVAQPYLTLGYTLGDPKTLAVTPYVGTWNSLHDEHTYNAGDADLWYESETMAGAVLSRGPVSLDVQYKLFSYPNGALAQIEEVSAKLSADLVQVLRGTERSGDVVVMGWVQFAKEIADRNDPPVETAPAGGQRMTPAHAPIFHLPDPDVNGAGDGEGFDMSGQGFYMELGLEPSFKTSVGRTLVGLAFPVTLGTSLDGYYQQPGGSNDFLGYASAGAQLTVPLDVPDRFGKWYLSASFTYLHLLADSATFANGGDEREFIGAIGINFLY